MSTMQCTHRGYTIIADVMEYPGAPTPWAAGCRITDPAGQVSRRLPVSVEHGFMEELEKAQRLSIAHGKWLVDQCLDHGLQLFSKAA